MTSRTPRCEMRCATFRASAWQRGSSARRGDNLTIRGFTARNDIFLDGIRDFGSYYRDSFDYEQVEVLEGPAGVQFGRGSTGGVINQESKAPGVHSRS